MLIFASRLRRVSLATLVLGCCVLSSGCWPALHHRSPRLMDRGQTELGVAVGLGGTMTFADRGQATNQPGETGIATGALGIAKAEEGATNSASSGPIEISEVQSMEGQAWIRGTPGKGVEVGIRACHVQARVVFEREGDLHVRRLLLIHM